MKMMIGFTLGVGVGFYLASQMTDTQRARVAARTSGAAHRVTATVSDSSIARSIGENASKVSTAVADRVNDAVDSAGDAAADAIGSPDDSTARTTCLEPDGRGTTLQPLD